jgi:hypothetical protein
MSQNVSLEGDPGKHAYLHNPNWKPAPRENLRDVKAAPGTCFACVFGEGHHAETCALFDPMAREDAERAMYAAMEAD